MAGAGEPDETAANGLPLFVALDWVGDDSSFLNGQGGFTPLPSSMALGATWSPQLAEQAGQVMGRELEAAGVNLLLGPTLDVSDVPRPGSRGDLDTRTFGGDPFWVGQIGQAFIRGVQSGAAGGVVTAAKHFPGQGGSDRGPEDEVATVQKSVEQLRQIELAPFATVTDGGDLSAPGITPALMTSHIRYRGFQGNIRETTPPISLAPQLQDLMELPEFAAWRSAGGVLISDQLGVPALRRYYSPNLSEFPHRRVAQDAFLAGNDLLYLGRFALTDNAADQVTAIKETILFFQEKYKNDSAFAARVDAAVERIVALKLRTYNGDWQLSKLERDPQTVAASVGEASTVTRSVARAGMTLIYPGRDQFADRLPAAPLANEKIARLHRCPGGARVFWLRACARDRPGGFAEDHPASCTGRTRPRRSTRPTFAALPSRSSPKPWTSRARTPALRRRLTTPAGSSSHSSINGRRSCLLRPR